MFTRVVECTVKPGKTQELTNTILRDVVPLLKEQPGFVDETTLVSDTDPERILALSFWRSREDADRYNRDHYPQVVKLIEGLLHTAPKVQRFNVQNSLTHKIAAGRAA